ncbi:hypothetical protein [Cobetia sp. 1AS1]|uniref:hypothetical protein n=1 Tax=Cobetia sp. 1AS1 TaxID=3040016 RepID=UPI0024474CDB|nr:hypothetical protein [Cobetia sp. 1AS1]MDH2293775.1 hypothetical protein [Cobetia sp. 1AS1]
MKEKVSNIVVALIISGTILYSVGAFKKEELTYATVHFDGGFKKIGVIAEQRAFSEIEVVMDGNSIYSGNIEKVVSEIQNSIQNSDDPGSVVWKDGVRIRGSVGVSWVGSESNFKLTTDTIDDTSTEDEPIMVANMIYKLQNLDRAIKEDYVKHADDTLTYSEKPESSFLLSRLVSAFE